jgi:hypothetical protein
MSRNNTHSEHSPANASGILIKTPLRNIFLQADSAIPSDYFRPIAIIHLLHVFHISLRYRRRVGNNHKYNCYKQIGE